MPDPNQIEDFLASKIAQAVQASPDDALLGFLDVDHETQQAVLDALRNRPYRFQVDLLNGYIGFEEMWAAKPHSTVWRVPLTGGAVVPWARFLRRPFRTQTVFVRFRG